MVENKLASVEETLWALQKRYQSGVPGARKEYGAYFRLWLIYKGCEQSNENQKEEDRTA